jgi:hypothetical protein
VAEKCLYIASAMCDSKNEDIVGFDAIYDNVFPHGEAAAPEAEIFIAGTPHVGEAGKHVPSARRSQFSEKAGASALLRFTGKLLHVLLYDDPAFTACKGCSGVIEGEKKLRSLPFAFFPQGKRFLHHVLFGVQSSAFNGTLGERFLI